MTLHHEQSLADWLRQQLNNYFGLYALLPLLHHQLVRNIDDFELIDGVTEAIKHINQSCFLAIVVTNQPVIARGEVSWEELHEIHKKMETLLGKDGAYIDGIYICPHHPDKGFEGERPEYKIDCNCRKPKPGLLLQAAKDFNIDLSQSIMIGDSERDVEAGLMAGCKKCVNIETNNAALLKDSIKQIIEK